MIRANLAKCFKDRIFFCESIRANLRNIGVQIACPLRSPETAIYVKQVRQVFAHDSVLPDARGNKRAGSFLKGRFWRMCPRSGNPPPFSGPWQPGQKTVKISVNVFCVRKCFCLRSQHCICLVKNVKCFSPTFHAKSLKPISALSTVFPQILVDCQSKSIDFLSFSISFR